MTYKTKKNFYKTCKAVTTNTNLRKKTISYLKTTKLKNINLKLKLQLITYKLSSQLLKYISIYKNCKSNIKFNSILF